MKGFFGKYMVADATTGTVNTHTINPEWLRESLGGKGLGVQLLLDYAPAGVAPLAPENPLIFAVGPITDTRIAGSSRYVLVTKSPQTGFLCHSYSGGKIAEKMSRCGIDALVVTGSSAKPVYLEVTDNGAEFKDAADLWGMETYATEDALLSRYGGSSKAGAAVIGPAGERAMPVAIVANDKWRCAGRTGAGAVMGSKMVKGVVFAGTTKREVADPEGVKAFASETLADKKGHAATKAYKTFGTPMMVAMLNNANAFPTKYWEKGRMENFEAIAAPAMQEKCEVKPKSCPRCFMACGKLTKVKSGRHEGLTLEGPEYETLYAFGGLCGISEIEEIVHLNDLCDRLGFDTISGGNLVALAMEASKTGKIAEEVPFGDVEIAEKLLHQIVSGEGLGEVLSKGLVEAAKAWGMEDRAIHVKGMEPAGYDPRVLKGMGLAYATSDRGACHLRATFYKPELSGMIAPDAVEGKAKLFVDFEDRATLFDGLILCRFFRDFYQWDELAQILKVTTGIEADKAELERIAKNISDLARAFNLREGLTKADDWLPERFFDEPLPETGAVIKREELEQMRAEYYELRGWDKEGKPPKS
jgi:aldehyde:ferredoxin oxidoreductase